MAKRCNFDVEILEEMMFEILLRLPVISLLRFKSVCKRWYVLIKSPNFISMHHKFNLGRVSNLLMCAAPKSQQYKHINNHVFTIGPHDKSASEDFGILANPDTYVEFANGSCNGIVCYYDNDEATIYLSNPATREFKQLPPTSFESLETDEKFYQYGIAFGSGSTNIYDFKVFRLFIAYKDGMTKPTHKAFRAEMFTLSSNSWKQLQWGLDDRLQFVTPVGSFCANSFHFLAQRYKSPGYAIVCCDIHTERFRTMELPSVGRGRFVYLTAHKDFLSAVCKKRPELPSDTFREVWVMKDYGVVASWTKLYSIGQHGIPLFFWTEKDALVMEVQLTQLVLRHHDTLNCEPLEIDGYNPYFHFLLYQETLVSIM